MTTFAILATGASMSQAVADSVRGRCSVVAVSDAYRLAEWADALVSQDRAWWNHNPVAMQFAGRKFSGSVVPDVEKFPSVTGSNSGLLGCQVAVMLGAKRILLLGFDMRGSHFFGPHPAPLRNTAPHRFEAFQDQFRRFQPRGVEIINCTLNSALKAYRKASLNDCLP